MLSVRHLPLLSLLLAQPLPGALLADLPPLAALLFTPCHSHSHPLLLGKEDVQDECCSCFYIHPLPCLRVDVNEQAMCDVVVPSPGCTPGAGYMVISPPSLSHSLCQRCPSSTVLMASTNPSGNGIREAIGEGLEWDCLSCCWLRLPSQWSAPSTAKFICEVGHTNIPLSEQGVPTHVWIVQSIPLRGGWGSGLPAYALTHAWESTLRHFQGSALRAEYPPPCGIQEGP